MRHALLIRVAMSTLAGLATFGTCSHDETKSHADPDHRENPANGLGLEDIGIFSDLDAKVSFALPATYEKGETEIAFGREKRTLTLLYRGVAVKTYPFPLRDEDAAELYTFVPEGTRPTPHTNRQRPLNDKDEDGIPNPVDIHMGALKTVLNGASYDASYQPITYPGGDVPRERGCCADVVVRAFRNAGIDLQEEIQKDIAARPNAYRHVKIPNASIDHRRVKNLLIYFKKHLKSVSAELTNSPSRSWLPGDIVLFDTLPKPGPDHIGIVTSKTDPNAIPLVINNWTTGSTTDQLELLSWCPITHHFRMK